MTQFQNPFMNPYGFGQQYQTPVYQQSSQVVKVSGENGARAYQMGANSSALLLDENGLMVWLVTSDGAGYKTIAPYDITPHKTVPVPDYSDLESRIKKLEDMMGGKQYDAGHPSAVRESTGKSDGRTSQANDEHGAYVRKPTGNAEPTYHEQSAIETGNGSRQPVRWGSNESIPDGSRAEGY